MEMGRWKNAVTTFEAAVEHEPHLADAWYAIGLCYANLGSSHEAIEAFDRVIGINPKNMQALVHRGIALVSLGRYADAITGLNRAIEIVPRDEKAWFYKGISLSELSRFEEAIRAFERVLEVNRRCAELSLRKVMLFPVSVNSSKRSSRTIKLSRLNPTIQKPCTRKGLPLPSANGMRMR